MSAPGPNPAGASWPGDLPRPATNLPNMNAPSPSPVGASGAGDRPRPATNEPNTRRNIAGLYPMATYNTTQSQDNHAPHGAHANWFGTVNHIASGESALLQDHQLGQPATHQLNFSPGSYATFPTQQYQNIGRLETHQPSHNAPASDGDAAFRQSLDDFTNHSVYGDEAGDSSSREFAENTAVDVNGLENPAGLQQPSPNDLHSPSLYSKTQTQQQSSMPTPTSAFVHNSTTSHEQQPMHSNIAHAPNVSTQHDASNYAACPRAVEHVPANGTSDRSGSNIQRNQKSMPQTQPKRSRTKKRRISKVGDGSADSSSGTPKKKRATATKRKPLDYVPTNFGGVCIGMAAGAAEERLEKMVWLNLEEPDDVEEVAAHREFWIRSIMSSFDKPYSATPVVEDFGVLLPRFKPWQDDQYSSAMKVIKADEIGNLVEAVATSIYSKIISSHRLQILDHGGDTFHCDPTLKCSERLSGCIEAIEKLAIIRQDVIKNLRIAELISNPPGMMKRKEDNKINNDRRAIAKKQEEALRKQEEALKKQERESKSQDDSSESKRENKGSAGSEVPAQSLTEPQDNDA